MRISMLAALPWPGRCLVVALAVLTGVVTARAAEVDLPMAGAVVEIIRPGGSLGAGVHIEKGLVLTAAHLVASQAFVTVRDDKGREQEGTVVVRDTVLDVALVTITRPLRLGVSRLSCQVPPIGLPVRMIGHPMGQRFTTIRGYVVSGLRSLNQWPTLVYVNPRAFPGMSGGPVMASGNVVGLVVAATSRGRRSGPAGAVPGSAICAIMPREVSSTQPG